MRNPGRPTERERTANSWLEYLSESRWLARRTLLHGFRPPGRGLRKGGKMLRHFAVAWIISLAMPLPLFAQSDETCIAYMEADAAYTTARDKAEAEHAAAIDAAGEAYQAVLRSADSRRDAVWREANKAKAAARDALKRAEDANLATLRKSDAVANAAQDKTEKAWRAARQAADEAHKRALERWSSIKNFDESHSAYAKASAAKRAAYKRANQNREAVIGRLSLVRKKAIQDHKLAQERAQSVYFNATEKSRSYISEAERIYRDVKRKATAANQAKRRAAVARRDTALERAMEGWGRAYGVTYQGPTSDISSVFQKLVIADRERCRQRGM